MSDSLTPKQARFVDEYLIDLNATQAAKRAGYSEKTAGSIGSENLHKPEIQAALSKRQADLAERVEIDQAAIVRRLALRSNLDIGELVEWGGSVTVGEDQRWVTMKPSGKLPDHIRRAVESVEVKDNGTIKLKLFPKAKAEELLMRHLGMLNDRLDLTGSLHAGVRDLSEEKIKELEGDPQAMLRALQATGEGE